MHRPQIIRLMVSPRLQLSAAKLAPRPLLMGQRWVAPGPQQQQLRPVSAKRRHINKEFKTTLHHARMLQDEEQRRQAFFDVARRYIKSNGSSADLKDSPGTTMVASRLGEPTRICDDTVLDPHNVRYSIERNQSRNWKVWVAVDAELEISSFASHDDGLLSEMGDSQEPVFLTVVSWMNQKLAEACKGTGGHMEVGNGHVELPENVDLELLFWDIVISLELNTRTQAIRTHWVGKIGERQVAHSETFVFSLAFLLGSTFDWIIAKCC